MDAVWSFDVTVSSHELLKRGVVAGCLCGSQHAHHRIVVAAITRNEAALTAALMASEHTLSTGEPAIVTGVYDRI